MHKKLHLGVTYLTIEKTKTFSVWDKVNSVFWCKTVQLLGSVNKRILFLHSVCTKLKTELLLKYNCSDVS